MKLFPLISLLLILTVASCSSETTNEKKDNINKNSKDTITTTFKMLSHDSLTVLLNRAKRFAEEYKPVSNSNLGIALLINVPDSIVYSYKQLRIHGNTEYEKYLTLIYLKIYRSHLQCCHQGYELRTHISEKGNIDSLIDPLLYEFNLISKLYDNSQRIEFINSAMGDKWIEKNEQLKKYNEIKKEYQRIEKIYTDIDNGVYH